MLRICTKRASSNLSRNTEVRLMRTAARWSAGTRSRPARSSSSWAKSAELTEDRDKIKQMTEDLSRLNPKPNSGAVAFSTYTVMTTASEKPSPAKPSHFERTATEPREDGIYPVLITKITPVDPTTRLFRLTPFSSCPINFKPGQWLDVFVPGIEKPGRFTITTSPSKLPRNSTRAPYHLDLAVRFAESNPVITWLWEPTAEVLRSKLQVRVGGSFVWDDRIEAIVAKNGMVLMVAGGLGINPLMSMISFLVEEKLKRGKLGFKVKLLYSVKAPTQTVHEILFLDRLRESFKILDDEGSLTLFLTSTKYTNMYALGVRRVGFSETKFDFVKRYHLTQVRVEKSRIFERDILQSLGDTKQRKNTVCFVCGPAMPDKFVRYLDCLEGIDEENVLYERWY